MSPLGLQQEDRRKGDRRRALRRVEDKDREQAREEKSQKFLSLLELGNIISLDLNIEEILLQIARKAAEVMNADRGTIFICDEKQKELWSIAATGLKGHKIRIPAKSGLAGNSFMTGETINLTDVYNDPRFNRQVDAETGYKTTSILSMPIYNRLKKRIGVFQVINKHTGAFGDDDETFLRTFGSHASVFIEIAQLQRAKIEYLQKTKVELEVLNRAKDKALNHLSHELRTPLAAISGALTLIEKKLKPSPTAEWDHNLAVAKRNLNRIRGIQNEAEDIIQQRQDVETETSKMGPQAEPNISLEHVDLVRFIGKTLERMKPLFPRRAVDISIKGEESAAILMDSGVLAKILEGLFKNALENIPDEGKVEIVVEKDSSSAILKVRDFGVGITEENQKHIFSGFYPTQPTDHYSSKRPFDFNAGGKGLDLLRMKIFAERYPFDISFESRRCLFLPTEIDLCPGRISECKHCESKEDCYQSGGSIFVLAFSVVMD